MAKSAAAFERRRRNRDRRTASPAQAGRTQLGALEPGDPRYNIADAGSIELLAQVCTALDRAEALAECVGRDGVMIYGKHWPERASGH
jgi:hypothetical protein